MLNRLVATEAPLPTFGLYLIAIALCSGLAASGLTYAVMSSQAPAAPEVCELPTDKLGAFLELDSAAL